MPDIFLYPGEANPSDVKLTDPTTLAGGAPPVTGTATWEQAPATWDATASERFTSAAEWTQTAAWDGAGIIANPVSATASWEQTAAWEATATESIPASATFEQTASWDAAVTESIPSTATWSQDAAWAALGLNAEDVLADATWEQSAASWLAASTQVITGSGTWEQLNVWEAAGQSAEDVFAAGAWEQSAEWAAVTATSIAPTPVVPRPVAIPRRVRPRVFAVASFEQQPASWAADMRVARLRDEVEELVLVGAI